MNFKITKIGLLNFWLYDEEEFEFYDGKLLLRGENGSGKSVTMQSFIPLILDGNKLPSRLDPFGSREKRIENYVLGTEDIGIKEEATSYLYMECYSESLGKYITIGLGFHARKGSNTTSWGFVIKNGQRINKDFFLYKDYGGKIPLSKGELKARLGVDNEFTDNMKDYKQLVNDNLFGFEDITYYDEFINVLLQLRSSKLSKEYTPTKLMEIMSSVLTPLSGEDLRPLSDAIEEASKIKEKIEGLESEVKAINNYLKTIQNYNEIMLYNKALNVSDNIKTLKTNENKVKEITKKIDETEKELSTSKTQLEKLKSEETTLKSKKEAIEDKDILRLSENLSTLKEELKTITNEVISLKERLTILIKKDEENDLNIKNNDNLILALNDEIALLINDLIEISEKIKLPEITTILKEYIKNKEINFEYIDTRISKYETKLNEIKQKLEKNQDLENKLNEEEINLNNLTKELNTKAEEKEKLLNNFEHEKEKFKDNINLINKENEIIKLDEEDKIKIFSLINDYSTESYITSLNIYKKISSYFEKEYIEKRINIKNKIEDNKTKLDTLNEELETLKNEKEITFISDDEVNITKEKLNSLNIPFEELYKVIEFKSNLNETDKNKIEELLISSHLINSLLIKKDDIKKLPKDYQLTYITSSIKKEKNLLDYFDITGEAKLTKEEIKDILMSISTDEKDNNYFNKNNFKFDYLFGLPSGNIESKYIGVLKRKELHEKKIKEKKDEITSTEEILENLNKMLNKINSELNLIDSESNKFPKNNELEIIQNNLKEMDNYIDYIGTTIVKVNESISSLNKEIEDGIKTINKLREDINLPLTLPSFNEALINTKALTKMTNDFRNKHISLINLTDKKKNLEYLKENSLLDVKEKTKELNEKNNSETKLKNKIKSIEEVLREEENAKLLEEIEYITRRLNEIPSLIEKLSISLGRKENDFEKYTEELTLLNENLEKNRLIYELSQIIFDKELKLKYVYNEEKEPEIILKELESRKNSDLTMAINNFFKAFNDYRLELQDYHLNTSLLFNENDSLIENFVSKGLEKEEIEKLLNIGARQDVKASYQGKIVNMYELKTYLEAAVNENKNYITIKENRLFEDILLKTVGKKIRNRIALSKEWISKINNIMKVQGENSDLSFTLEWKSKEALTEDELDTKELVRLFQIDAGLMDKSDSDKLINHFRSKINKELEENKDLHESYADIISRILDYRTWFEFKMYYKRKTQGTRELTNKMFMVFSGGERAKSMYVPLFAAVNAKLLSAKDYALRVVALDEAYAGVDEGNINEMFGILKDLNIGYILTSQSLWGDYQNVNDLSICELIKDSSTNTVGVRRYRWNGKEKIVLEGENK